MKKTEKNSKKKTKEVVPTKGFSNLLVVFWPMASGNNYNELW